jgi:hypothetical protein
MSRTSPKPALIIVSLEGVLAGGVLSLSEATIDICVMKLGFSLS